jgi:glycosyltransferase involved in cell wall biosynthesis
MPGPQERLRRDLTPCILHTDLSARGGGLARAVPERASLYARHFERVLVLTTGFSPRVDAVVAELQARGTLDERVVVRNFFRDSAWVRGLAAPPPEALAEPVGPGAVPVLQSVPGRPPFRVADRRPSDHHPHRYRYYDADGRLMLTTTTVPGKKFEVGAEPAVAGTAGTSWSAIVAQWVDQELESLRRPVLFSLQRGLVDPVLLETTKASRKVVSLHNCHYRDPQDRTSGTRWTFRAVLDGPRQVDEVVCLTEQQRRELSDEAPHAVLRSIPYPGRVPKEAPEPTDDRLVVIVARLEARKRVDHAVRAFAAVVAAVPDARLEVYGSGPELPALEQLVDELGLHGSVSFKGYSLTVGAAQSRAACTLLTSTFEGFARVISESMSRGTPVVAYDVRYGPRDLIRDRVDGILVTRHEPDALATAIIELLLDPQRAAAMGERAREVLDRFPVADFERAWLRVLSPRPRPVRVVLADWRVRVEPVRRRLAAVRRVRLRTGVASSLPPWFTLH